ncbi:coatamer protein, beta subunit, putative [Plasmodium vivax]|uniref:Coatamer protein, beta subunit n=4 Tax=Plasmodium vivax TaxID=5855 RepID=A0A0J9T7J0_PLAVI|nr:hypothetical protein PVIIG_01329 [Plasmodium vivax India VII]KMZ90941.1 coatamer protein, beta subunit [Plasmodium vivax Mauritania I]KMZ97484.1 coatamer protein, beta subunit [Plasmodium vivax North Korean]CAG9475751.1 unnamed protein product [Plasmodium vivax]SCO69308.1 coatamer protein, beta subunit, putative [Plasmodium vivax]
MGSPELEKNCTLYICTDNCETASNSEIQKKLESQNVEKKIEGMEHLIFNIIQGEPCGNLLMCVIRFIVPHKDHRLKKLTHIFFEVVDKCKSDGSLKEEMLLVCNALRNDIISPNEYVRGSTLRLLSKIKNLKIIEPLIEAITKNLSHRHSYVRKNAISCIHTIIKEHGGDVIPNSVKEVEKILFLENDISTKRSALSMLIDVDPMTTLKYILSLNDQLYDTADVILLEVIHLFKKLYIPHVFDSSFLLIGDEDEEGEAEEEEEEDKSGGYQSDGEIDLFAYLLSGEEAPLQQGGAPVGKRTIHTTGMNQALGSHLLSGSNPLGGTPHRSNESSGGMLNVLSEEIQFRKNKLCESDYSQYKSNVVKILLNMMSKNVSNSVLYEGACCLLYMSSSEVSIKTASECFIKLLINQHDNNIKLIVIDRLYYIMCKWKKVLESYVMDLLRALNFPSRDIKVKILNLVLHILSSRNVHLVLGVLKKELLKLNTTVMYSKNVFANGGGGNGNAVVGPSNAGASGGSASPSGAPTPGVSSVGETNTVGNNLSTNYQEMISYKKILLKSMQHICNMFSNECLSMVDLLLTYVNDEEREINYEAAVCIRKLANNPSLQSTILQKIGDVIFDVKQPHILRIFFWVLGQYMQGEELILKFLDKLYEHLVPLLGSNIQSETINRLQSEKFKKSKMVMNFNANSSPASPTIQTKTVVLEDGTYATEAVWKKQSAAAPGDDSPPGELTPFAYNLLADNDDLLLSVLCVCITKLYLKLVAAVGGEPFRFLGGAARSADGGAVDKKCATASPAKSAANSANAFRNKGIYILASVVKYLGQKNASKSALDAHYNDSNVVRVSQCLKIFLNVTCSMGTLDDSAKKLIRTFLSGDEYYQKFLHREGEKYSSVYSSVYPSSYRQLGVPLPGASPLGDATTDGDHLGEGPMETPKGVTTLPPPPTQPKENKQSVDDEIYFRILKEKKNVLNILEERSTLMEERSTLMEERSSSLMDERAVLMEENLEKLKLKYTLSNDILFGENEFKLPSFKHDCSSLFMAKLYNSQRLTGTDDDLFIEAVPIVSNVNLIVEFYIYNQSGAYLQSIFISLSTHGNLKPIDKIPEFNLAPNEKRKFKITVKVHTTEAGIIFGYVFYERKNENRKNYIVLSELHINMTDYISASFISSHLFRVMWSEFEWENKINISTSIRDAFELLKLIIKHTNMTIVEKFMPLEYYEKEAKNRPEQANVSPIDIYISYISSLEDLKCLVNNSAFFAVNLFSRSIFGEDSLANLSVQKNPDGRLSGSIRVRSRTQGIALSLGDKITLVQTGLSMETQ